MTSITPAMPVAIIGGGPVGLAAAAHLAERGLPFIILASGPEAGHSVRSWGHIFPENVASYTLHLDCGFREVGRRERIALMNHGPFEGRWRNTIILEWRSSTVGI